MYETPIVKQPPRSAWTVALAGLGAFMTALDVVVVSTALPTLQHRLGASLATLEWTLNAYSLVFGALMLTGAALGDRFGRRRMYVLGLMTFVAGSAFAAMSSGPGMLIAARVVQGAGAAVLVPLTLTLISDAFPAEKRGAAIGLWGGITGLGVATGPVVGGAIVQGLSWQRIFWLNVPVGLAVAALSSLRLVESRRPRLQLDLAGMALTGAGLFALTWAPVRAPSVGWGSPEVAGSLAAGAALMAAFLGHVSNGSFKDSRNPAMAALCVRMWATAGNSRTDGISCGYDSSESTPPRATRRRCGIPTQAST